MTISTGRQVINRTGAKIGGNGAALAGTAVGDVARAVAALNEKSGRYELLWRYYDGDHPQVYTNKRLGEIFRDIDAHFAENWCAVVVDALDDRVNLEAVRLAGGKKKAQRTMDRLWRDLGLAVEVDDCHQAAFVTGEAFLIAWPDAAGQPDAYYNDPRLVHVFYESGNPRQKRLAAKWWYDDAAGAVRLTLYYRDRLEYYVASDGGPRVGLETVWKLLGRAVNPHGEIPVFHLRSTRRHKSDLKDALPIQIAINKLVNDLMVAAEYGAFRQRWVISQSDVLDDLVNSPNEIWNLPGGDGVGQETRVGEFQGSDLGPYINGLDHFAGALAAITRTPKHYFFSFNSLANLSGETLLTMEAPLAQKAAKRIELFKPEWRRAMAFLLRLAGERVTAADVEASFAAVASMQPLTQAQVRRENKEAGIPLTTQLRLEGWSDDELAQMRADMLAELGGLVIP